MTVEDFFRSFNLHDSGVDRVAFAGDRGRLSLWIDLCNYDQPSFRPGEPESLPGLVEFYGVSDFHSTPALESIAWGPKCDGEILEAGPVVGPPAAGPPAYRLAVSVMNYETHEKTFLLIVFRATMAVWSPGNPSGG